MKYFTKFEEIEAWRTARKLVNLIYDLSDSGSFSEDFALKNQIRRACISAMSNIAEGYDSGTKPLFARYLRIAKGSTGEVQSQLYIARDRTYISDEAFEHAFRTADSTARQLRGLIRYLERE